VLTAIFGIITFFLTRSRDRQFSLCKEVWAEKYGYFKTIYDHLVLYPYLLERISRLDQLVDEAAETRRKLLDESKIGGNNATSNNSTHYGYAISLLQRLYIESEGLRAAHGVQIGRKPEKAHDYGGEKPQASESDTPHTKRAPRNLFEKYISLSEGDKTDTMGALDMIIEECDLLRLLCHAKLEEYEGEIYSSIDRMKLIVSQKNDEVVELAEEMTSCLSILYSRQSWERRYAVWGSKYNEDVLSNPKLDKKKFTLKVCYFEDDWRFDEFKNILDTPMSEGARRLKIRRLIDKASIDQQDRGIRKLSGLGLIIRGNNKVVFKPDLKQFKKLAKTELMETRMGKLDPWTWKCRDWLECNLRKMLGH
jgi:hypothetical protein